MNNGFAIECARETGRRLLSGPERSHSERVRTIYLRLLGRPATRDEITASEQFLSELNPPSRERSPDLYRWSTLIQALMISGEFRSLL